jgi:glycosyltransferase involved in cell wall biosynthesis
MDPRKQRLPKTWAILRRMLYRTAARVVSVSAGVDAFFAWLPEAKRAVIPNPITWAELDRPAADPQEPPWPHTVMAMGRLEEEKGFDVLIHAFAQLSADFPDWGLTILGEGSQRDRLESLAQQLDLTDRVRMPGAIHEPFATLKKADLFVLSSRHEGFGNALVEAMACGVAVIATDCWHTPPEIVRRGLDGILVPPNDAEALAAAMVDLMSDPGKRLRLAAEAVRSAKRYDLALVSQTWAELLQTVVAPQDAPPPESAPTSPP